MAKNESTGLPRFESLNEVIEFFDTSDMGEYWEQMPEAHFDVNIKKRKHWVAIDEEISEQLTEIAKSKRISSEQLVNSWLKEKIQKVS